MSSGYDYDFNYASRDRSRERFRRLMGERRQRVSVQDFKEKRSTGSNALITLVNDPGTMLEMIPQRQKRDEAPAGVLRPEVNSMFESLGMGHFELIPKKAALLACGESILDGVLSVESLRLAQTALQRLGADFNEALGRYVIAHVIAHNHVHKIGSSIRKCYHDRRPSQWSRFVLEQLGSTFFRDFDERCLRGLPPRSFAILTQAVADGMEGTSSSELGHEAIKQLTPGTIQTVGLQFLQELPLPAIQTLGDELHFELESNLEDTGAAMLEVLIAHNVDISGLRRFEELDPNEEYVDDDFFDSIVDSISQGIKAMGLEDEIAWAMLDIFARRQLIDPKSRKVTEFVKDVLGQKGANLLSRAADKILETFHENAEELFHQWFLSKAHKIMVQLQRSGELEKEPLSLLNHRLEPVIAAKLFLNRFPIVGGLASWASAEDNRFSKTAGGLLSSIGNWVLQGDLLNKLPQERSAPKPKKPSLGAGLKEKAAELLNKAKSDKK